MNTFKVVDVHEGFKVSQSSKASQPASQREGREKINRFFSVSPRFFKVLLTQWNSESGYGFGRPIKNVCMAINTRK